MGRDDLKVSSAKTIIKFLDEQFLKSLEFISVKCEPVLELLSGVETKRAQLFPWIFATLIFQNDLENFEFGRGSANLDVIVEGRRYCRDKKWPHSQPCWPIIH